MDRNDEPPSDVLLEQPLRLRDGRARPAARHPVPCATHSKDSGKNSGWKSPWLLTITPTSACGLCSMARSEYSRQSILHRRQCTRLIVQSVIFQHKSNEVNKISLGSKTPHSGRNIYYLCIKIITKINNLSVLRNKTPHGMTSRKSLSSILLILIFSFTNYTDAQTGS